MVGVGIEEVLAVSVGVRGGIGGVVEGGIFGVSLLKALGLPTGGGVSLISIGGFDAVFTFVI